MSKSEQLSLAVQGKYQWSRRDFVVSSLATGFAAAVQPVSAQTITTDTKGIRTYEMWVGTAQVGMPAFVATPDTGDRFPVVLVVQEIFGVHEHIKDICRRFAKLGYLAIAPELYARQGDVSKLKDNKEIFSQVVSKVSDAQVMGDLDACVAWARSQPNLAHPSKLAITGFCWGGRITWLYAAHNPAVTTAVAWYGRLVGDSNAMTPKNPIDFAASLKVPVLGLYGGADAGIPNDTVERMRTALKAAGSKSDIVLYPDTPHAFHADYRPSYRKQQSDDGWTRLQAWFRQHGM